VSVQENLRGPEPSDLLNELSYFIDTGAFDVRIQPPARLLEDFIQS
jgi:hypothetical protein